MNSLRSLLAGLVAATAIPAFAADDIALVMEVAGAVEYRESDSADFQTLEPNTALDADDFIRSHEGGAATLLYTDTNKIVRIESMEGLSVGARKTESRPEQSLLSRAIQSLMGEDDIGANAATRGLGEITLLSPTDSKVSGNSLTLVWEGGMGSRPFNVTIAGPDGAELLKTQVPDRKIAVDLEATNAPRGAAVSWSVNMDRAGDEYAKGGLFTRASEADEQELNAEIDAIKSENSGLSESALEAAIALHCADEGYYFAALEGLEKARAAADDPAPYDALIQALHDELSAD